MLKARLNEEGNLSEIIDYDVKVSELNESKKLELVQLSIDDEVMGVIGRKNESRRTIADLKKIVLREKVDKKYDELLKKLDDEFMEFIPQHKHNLDLGEFDEAETYISVIGNKIYQKWRKCENNVGLINEKIQLLKSELSSTDYKIIKAYEAKLSMSDAPYTQDELDKIIAERQALRDKINELEGLLNK